MGKSAHRLPTNSLVAPRGYLDRVELIENVVSQRYGPEGDEARSQWGVVKGFLSDIVATPEPSPASPAPTADPDWPLCKCGHTAADHLMRECMQCDCITYDASQASTGESNE
jgi:hypothetical protein